MLFSDTTLFLYRFPGSRTTIRPRVFRKYKRLTFGPDGRPSRSSDGFATWSELDHLSPSVLYCVTSPRCPGWAGIKNVYFYGGVIRVGDDYLGRICSRRRGGDCLLRPSRICGRS